jgi:hypothetical protein
MTRILHTYPIIYLLFYSPFSSRLHREPFLSLLPSRCFADQRAFRRPAPSLPSPSLAHSLFLRALSKVSSLCRRSSTPRLASGRKREAFCVFVALIHTLCSYVRYRRDGLCGPRSRVLTGQDRTVTTATPCTTNSQRGHTQRTRIPCRTRAECNARNSGAKGAGPQGIARVLCARVQSLGRISSRIQS